MTLMAKLADEKSRQKQKRHKSLAFTMPTRCHGCGKRRKTVQSSMGRTAPSQKGKDGSDALRRMKAVTASMPRTAVAAAAAAGRSL